MDLAAKPGPDHRSPGLNPLRDPLKFCSLIRKMEMLTCALLTSQGCCEDQVR